MKIWQHLSAIDDIGDIKIVWEWQYIFLKLSDNLTSRTELQFENF